MAPANMHRVIVVGVDGSAGGYAAVAEAAEIAKRFNADLLALSVEEGMPKVPTLMDEVDEFKRKKDRYFAEVTIEAKRIAGEHGAKLSHEIRIGDAALQIVRFIDEVDADLVVLGYKGHSRLALVIGTTAQKVNAQSRASVLIVKPTKASEAVWGGIFRIQDP
jgi:nucleotide-binding universal stress UspA family protein